MKINDFIPPIAITVKNRLMRIVKKRLGAVGKLSQPRACHLNSLFVTYTGDVYPCSDVWSKKSMRIGNIKDDDFEAKVAAFNSFCKCERYTYKSGKGEKPRYDLISIEFGLECQAKCAMCCVDAPDYKGEYDNDIYGALSKLMAWAQPISVSVEGGEVLIQKKTVKWLETLKESSPDLKFNLITNGNVSLEMIPTVEHIFDDVWVSIVGFQPETYRKIMGMDINRTMAFVETLVKNSRVLLTAKFLVTPLNLHEANLFLEWVARIAPHQCAFQDAESMSYINLNTRDVFWQKIICRTGADVRKFIVTQKEALRASGTVIKIDTRCRDIYGITDEIIKESEGVVVWMRS